MLDFKDLKKNRVQSTQSLIEQVDKLASPFSGEEFPRDSRIWYPETDKAGNGSAIIRFMPAPKGEDAPFVRLWHHHFKGPTGKTYSENSLTTIGKKDPVGEYNSVLWKEGSDECKKQARDQKRKLTYYANIMVLKDPMKPENNGKVFLFRFGKKVFDKVMASLKPTSVLDDPVNPFDFWEGANFRVRIANVDGYRNYDQSTFDSPSQFLDGDDEALKKVWESLYSLDEFIAPDKFKSYEILKSKFEEVMGLGETRDSGTVGVSEEPSRPTTKPTKKASKPEPERLPDDPADGDDDDVMSEITSMLKTINAK